MAGPYIKSLVYLAVFTGIGYACLQLTTPTAEAKQEIQKKYSNISTDEQRRKQVFIEQLRQVTNRKDTGKEWIVDVVPQINQSVVAVAFVLQEKIPS